MDQISVHESQPVIVELTQNHDAPPMTAGPNYNRILHGFE
jgi:hypothetical protein